MDWQNTYPRPQMKRDSFFSLDGAWLLENRNTEVSVPGCITDDGTGEVLVYVKRFALPDDFGSGRMILHFGAADQKAEVYLNGHLLGSHAGGYNHFSFDCTDALRPGENELRLRITDALETHELPYGKQRMKKGGMWYTPVSGLWQSVWMESVPEDHICEIRITPQLASAEISVTVSSERLKYLLQVRFQGKMYSFESGTFTLHVPEPENWTPENPVLYPFSVTYGEDTVTSYFALRTVTCGEVNGIPRILLNGKPYFFHGVLDQGYFSPGIYTPASPETYEKDILFLKSCGFNMLRKHIKVEPDIFYYLCDKLGLAVFQDMVNNGDYSFFKDTLLPTLGLKDRRDRKLNQNASFRINFIQGMKETVHQLYNFPSICYWTVFNEGWGQFDGDENYLRLKALDQTRIIDTASGWFRVKNTDVESTHIYFKKIQPHFTEKPYVLSEYGGYNFKVCGHTDLAKKNYGYRQFQNPEAYKAAVCALLETEVLPYVKEGLCAAVYTQLSDVEDELNGLMTYDRAVVKVDAAEMKALGERIRNEISKTGVGAPEV